MATFDEKEFLWDDMYNSVTVFIERKNGLGESFSEEMINDFRALRQFRRNIGGKNPEEIDFDEAMNFYRDLKNKYKSMSNKW
ncbi:hypothetical protein [Gilliamella apicola]|uniref:hypothetical protein n=1 Tax=Gilliamella apicola TaxID=1196095 RepID=UPI002FEE4629